MSAAQMGLLAEIGVSSPWMNVPGFLDYLPPSRLEIPVEMGAFLPPSLSFSARNPAAVRAALPFPGGMLLRTGLPNPGMAAALKKYGQRWERLVLPLWLSLLPRNAAEVQEMSALVDDLECAVAFQMLLPRGASTRERAEILSAAQGEKPFFVELPLDEVCREAVEMIQKSAASGVVVSAPRGILQRGEQWVSGRLYGPAFYPRTALAVRDLVREKVTVLAGCGVSTAAQGQALLDLGAIVVQFDVVLWG